MKLLHKLFILMGTASIVVGCGGGGGGGGGGGFSPPPPPLEGACSVNTQKQFVLDNMLFWYLWNDRLPTNVNIDDYATPDALLGFLSTFSPPDGSGNPVDRFSFLTTSTADASFFNEGEFEGFGFSYRAVAPDDYRFIRVFTNGPAGRAGLARGQRIVALDGRPVEEIGSFEAVNAIFDNPTVEFTLRPVGGNPDGSGDLVRSVTQDIVTIDPVPQDRTIVAGARKIGYIEFSSFISTAEPRFAEIFEQYAAENVEEVIIDMRYNGGGLVRTAELLGDYLGGFVAPTEIFSRTQFNTDRSGNNSEKRFAALADSINLTQFVVIASRGTASASELVINGLGPHVNTTIIGDTTFGKPVGQIGLELQGCDVLLRPTSFKSVNSTGAGDFFDGLPVDCVAEDDLNVPVGDAADPNLVAALYYLDNLSCPPGTMSAAGIASKTTAGFESRRPDLTGPPWREFADAY